MASDKNSQHALTCSTHTPLGGAQCRYTLIQYTRTAPTPSLSSYDRYAGGMPRARGSVALTPFTGLVDHTKACSAPSGGGKYRPWSRGSI